MKAAAISEYGSLDNIKIEELPIPQLKANEVQIKVHHAGLNPVDWKIALGYLKDRMPFELPIILGWDVAGEISAIGDQVSSFKKGDPVFAYCRKEKIKDGSCAEYINLLAANVSLKPKSLSFAEAAAIPLSALTAWQALYEAGNLKKGQKVLIHAGAGGVGGYAIQLAKLREAFVFTTTSAANFEYVKQFGADRIIDYKKDNFAEIIRKECPEGVDLLFDTVGGETLQLSLPTIKKKGILVSIVQDVSHLQTPQLQTKYVFVRPDGKQLNELGRLFDQGTLIPPQIQELPLEKIQEALKEIQKGHTKGKIVLRI